MKSKILLTVVAICACLLVVPTANAATLNYTLYYDWSGTGSFSSTSIAFNTTTMTFVTGTGATGDWAVVGQSVAIIYRTGCCPLYTGPMHGFMDCRSGENCGSDPGWWYLGAPTAEEFTIPEDSIFDDGS